jgi:hypothetical protein
MKINEIVNESVASPLRKTTQNSTPGVQTWPDLDNGNVPYLQYRFGLAMAGSPDIDITNHGPVGGQLITIAYSSADQEIINGAAKIMGVIPKDRSSKKSQEVDTIQRNSPVQARGPIELKSNKKK